MRNTTKLFISVFIVGCIIGGLGIFINQFIKNNLLVSIITFVLAFFMFWAVIRHYQNK